MPAILLVLSALAGVAFSEFDTSDNDMWLLVIAYPLIILAMMMEINSKPFPLNWYSSQSRKTGKVIITVWTAKWLKIWLVTSILVFLAAYLVGVYVRGI